jgi:hypothetical protein
MSDVGSGPGTPRANRVGRDHGVALVREPLRHRTDVRIETENLLDEHEPGKPCVAWIHGPRRPLGTRRPGLGSSPPCPRSDRFRARHGARSGRRAAAIRRRAARVAWAAVQ